MSDQLALQANKDGKKKPRRRPVRAFLPTPRRSSTLAGLG